MEGGVPAAAASSSTSSAPAPLAEDEVRAPLPDKMDRLVPLHEEHIGGVGYIDPFRNFAREQHRGSSRSRGKTF